MPNISDNDKKIWKFYTSNLNTIKKAQKNREYNLEKIPMISKSLKPNAYFNLDNKIKRQLKKEKISFNAVLDLHGKSEIQAYETIKNFIYDSYFNEFKKIIIITGKGINNQGKLKLKTPLWLKNKELSKFVVGFERMPHNKGGDGALFVQLKNKNKYQY